MLQSSYSTCVLVSEENKEAIITSKDQRVRAGAGEQFRLSPLDGATELRRWLPHVFFCFRDFPLLIHFRFPETIAYFFSRKSHAA